MGWVRLTRTGSSRLEASTEFPQSGREHVPRRRVGGIRYFGPSAVDPRAPNDWNGAGWNFHQRHPRRRNAEVLSLGCSIARTSSLRAGCIRFVLFNRGGYRSSRVKNSHVTLSVFDSSASRSRHLERLWRREPTDVSSRESGKPRSVKAFLRSAEN